MGNGDVYTTYLTTGTAFDASHWHLARRTAERWEGVSSGLAGREPVNILRMPGDGIAVVAWPGGSPRLTIFEPVGAQLVRREDPIPGQWEVSHWPYNAAGVGVDGTLCLLQSSMKLLQGGLLWACRDARDGRWQFHRTPVGYRHCYAYVFPDGHRLTLVATRDVTWQTLGYLKPQGAIDYVFNQVHAFETLHRGVAGLAPILVREEVPTLQHPAAVANGQVDAYVDTQGRLHVLYTLNGQSTAGQAQTRHALIVDGHLVADVALPEQGYWRLTQDSTGAFWALYGQGRRFAVYPGLSEDGLQLGRPTELDLGDEQVRYSGMAIAAPRAGVPPADIVDGGLPSGRSGERWVYFRLRLR
jgi:hypothetical protein